MIREVAVRTYRGSFAAFTKSGPSVGEATFHAIGMPRARLEREPTVPRRRRGVCQTSVLDHRHLPSEWAMPKEDYPAIAEQVESALERTRLPDEAYRTRM